jgi:predicted nuclease of restriction endonuclease-like RecB superfamily
VISPELVRARKRGERLELLALTGPTRLLAERLSSELMQALRSAEGRTEEELEQLFAEIDRPASAEKLFAGLSKVLLDQCGFDAPVEVDAAELRCLVFELATAQRKQDDRPFDRKSVLEQVASARGLDVDTIERALFSDLRGARLLTKLPGSDAEELLRRYELAQVQGVLLRAVRIRLDVTCANAEAYRTLFRKLKFRRLLYRIEPREKGGYHIEIDGPFSLFESVTKYGLALAQLVPALRQCEEVQLVADLRWGKSRQPLTLQTSLGGESAAEPAAVRDEVQVLVEAVNRLGEGWTARLGHELFDVPGVGIVVPDVALEGPGGRCVYVEVMGYWSREAVFRRLDWMSAQARERGPDVRLLLAVSSQLRVSPDVVPAEAHGGVYVYKGTMHARTLLEQARALAEATA